MVSLLSLHCSICLRSLFVTLHSAGSGRTYAVGFSLFVVAVQLPVLPTLSAVYLKGRSLDRFCSLCIPLIISLPPTACLATCIPTIANLSQIYGLCRSESTAALSAAVSDCSTAIADWMGSHCLQLNADKTNVTWCTSVRRSSSVPVAPVIIAVVAVDPVFIQCAASESSSTRTLARSRIPDSIVVSRCFAALCQLRRYVTMTVSGCWSLHWLTLASSTEISSWSGCKAAVCALYSWSSMQLHDSHALRLRRYDHMTDELAVLH
jgi:hypothetical protein